jgi:YD repeat-containing protein
MPPADGITLDYLYDPDGYLRERHKWDARHQILEPEQR